MTDALTSATVDGGRGDGWPDDGISLAVWAATGSGAMPGEPEAEIDRFRHKGWAPEVVLTSLAPDLATQPADIVLAAAWSGLASTLQARARAAAHHRRAAIRRIPASVPDRRLADLVGLSHTLIARDRRAKE